ncbi:MAG: Ig-like domain-containing protein, partial [Rhodoferax sp.]|nr:Ig-like domain-containing protein [Rhodoferax sp.]
MKKFESCSRVLPWCMALLLGILVAGCGGGRDPILGAPGLGSRGAPTVTAVTPANNATGVSINNPLITATFSEAMAPVTGTASFTVTCAAPCANPPGATVALDATNRIATLTLAPATALAPLTLYTATVTGAKSLTTGLALASPFVWQFTTGATPDTIRPRVTLTSPATTIPGPTAGAPTNTAITAVFSEDMAPATITAAGTFTVTCVAPCVSPTGTVSYSVGSRTAVFAPAAALTAGATYTATITIAATDLASPGNALAGNQSPLPAASNYVWTFIAAAPAPAGNVSVLSTVPVAGAPGVCTNATVDATFDVPSGLRMDPATVNAANFTLTGPAPGLVPVTAATVVLDAATGRIATFTPSVALTAGNTYTALVRGGAVGVKDLAIPSNAMGADFTWTFTVVNCVAPTAPTLNSAATFGIMATAATTSTGPTLINGDVSLDPGTSQGIPPAQVNGTIHVNDAVSAQARVDLLTAYNFAKTLPPGTTVLGGTDLGASFPTGIPPGTYTSG